jgi:high-affinity nickel-transport protein
MVLSGILLMFMLGLRHGFDPDHIAIIDNIGVRYAATKPRLAKWTGTLFAAGHGSVVTCIAVMVSKVSHAWHFSQSTWDILDWMPGLILWIVGVMNLRMLLYSKTYTPKGFKFFFLPTRLKNSSSPMAIVLTGILFAMVFDTNTQAAAWAYTATARLSTTYALVLGGAFSAGMIITDTLDSRILFNLMKQAAGNQSVLSYRRKIGWIIVSISLLVGSYKLITHVVPGIELKESVLTIVGVSFFVLMTLFYSSIVYSRASANKKKVWQSKI